MSEENKKKKKNSSGPKPRRGLDGKKQKGRHLKFKEDLVIRPSDKPKLRKALINTVEQTEEAKVLTREMFLWEVLEKWKVWCEENDKKYPRKIGPNTIKRMPKEVLKTLDKRDMQMYVRMLKDMASTQFSALKIIDPFDTDSETMQNVKREKNEPEKSFEELLAETVKERSSGS